MGNNRLITILIIIVVVAGLLFLVNHALMSGLRESDNIQQPARTAKAPAPAKFAPAQQVEADPESANVAPIVNAPVKADRIRPVAAEASSQTPRKRVILLQ